MSSRLPMRLMVVALVASVLAGCLPGSSPPSDFFLLEPRAGDDVRQLPSQRPLAVNSVVLPPELERSELVRYGPSGQVELLDAKRWAAPLDDLVFRTLALNLAARLNKVVLPGQPKPEGPSRALDVIIERFGAGPGGELTLRAHWTIAGVDGETQIQRRTALSQTMPGQSADAIATAMGDALGRLAGEIASAVSELEA